MQRLRWRKNINCDIHRFAPGDAFAFPPPGAVGSDWHKPSDPIQFETAAETANATPDGAPENTSDPSAKGVPSKFSLIGP